MADIQKQIDNIEFEIQHLSRELKEKNTDEKEIILKKINQLINKKLKLINILYDYNKIINEEENEGKEANDNKPRKRKNSSFDHNENKIEDEDFIYSKGINGEIKKIN